MNMNNLEIKFELAKAGLAQWKLAEMLGISEWTLSRRLRRELPEEDKRKIIELIRSNAQ